MDFGFFLSRLVLVTVGTCCGFSLALAQEPGLTDPIPAQQSQQGSETEVWSRNCADAEDPATCTISQTLFIDKTIDGTTERLGVLLRATVSYVAPPGADTDRVLYLTMGVPLGVDLRGGVVFKVDEGEETNLRFLQCTKRGCDVSLVMGDELVQSLRLGSQLFVGFRGWGREDVNVVAASLVGFTSALQWLQR